MSDADFVAFLGIVRNAVERMATNSFLLKSWGVTLTAALMAVSVGVDNRTLVLLAYLPCVAFAGLDGYYLAFERRFRELYDDRVSKGSAGVSYAMDPGSPTIADWWMSMRSHSVWAFWMPIGVAIATVTAAWQ